MVLTLPLLLLDKVALRRYMLRVGVASAGSVGSGKSIFSAPLFFDLLFICSWL